MKFIKDATINKSINKAYLKIPVTETQIEKFKTQYAQMKKALRPGETEEYHKNLINDFLKNTWYAPDYLVNTFERYDSVIYNGSDASKAKPAVIIEVKSPQNKNEMCTEENMNVKALQELLLYFLREYVTNKNHELKKLIITNFDNWFIFDAKDFSTLFATDKLLLKQYDQFINNQMTDNKTQTFYTDIAPNFIQKFIESDVQVIHFTISSLDASLNTEDDKQLTAVYKLFSPETLLNKPFANDSNSLDKHFYAELLHIIGLEEITDGGKKLIQRKTEGNRQFASLIESALYQLEDEIKNEEKRFSTALRLVIVWINRLLFLKLLESQSLSYNSGDKAFKFLTPDFIKDFDGLNELFFKVLAKKPDDRHSSIKEQYKNVPYLNSSLFEKTDDEDKYLEIRGLKSGELELYNQTVLLENGVRKTGKLDTLTYIFEFLDAYNFASDGKGGIQKNNKTLINASVLGLIFEKINGYKDGSFFTPGYITQYMAKETISRAIVQKFNETKKWKCKNITDVKNQLDDYKEADSILNTLHICDPAVGSGHFLVSCLNYLIAIKSELGCLFAPDGTRIKPADWEISVDNDELSVTDENGHLYSYNPQNAANRVVQEALFYQKQIVIENCLFGVDINPSSVDICRLRLWIELLKNAYYKCDGKTVTSELQTLPNIDINIKCGNSLISKYKIEVGKSFLEEAKIQRFDKKVFKEYRDMVHDYKESHSKLNKREIEEKILGIKNTFWKQGELDFEGIQPQAKSIILDSLEWMFEFPEVLDDDGKFQGFDVVIGNPPYIQLQANGGTLGKLYENIKFETYFRMGDIYCLFFEQACKLLKQNGALSFINPNTWLQSISFSPVRLYLTSNFQWHKILIPNKVFDEATVDTHCILFEKETIQTKCKIYKTIDKKIVYLHSVPTEQITNKKDVINIEANPTITELIEKMKQKSNPLSDFFDIYNGVKPFEKGKGKPAQTAETLKTKPFVKEGEKPSNEWKPLMRGSLMHRYTNYWNNDYWILYGEWLAAARDPNIFDEPEKIIVRQTGDSIIATVIGKDIICRNNLHICVPKSKSNSNLKYSLGILNSRLTDFYYTFINPEKGEALAEVKKAHVEQLPIPVATPEQQKDIIALVDQILSAKKANPQADTTIQEAQIDQLVYKLYDLTDDEIQTVEGK